MFIQFGIMKVEEVCELSTQPQCYTSNSTKIASVSRRFGIAMLQRPVELDNCNYDFASLILFINI